MGDRKVNSQMCKCGVCGGLCTPEEQVGGASGLHKDWTKEEKIDLRFEE